MEGEWQREQRKGEGGAQKNAAECRALLSIYVNNFIEAPHTHTQSCLPEGQREVVRGERGGERDVQSKLELLLGEPKLLFAK